MMIWLSALWAKSSAKLIEIGIAIALVLAVIAAIFKKGEAAGKSAVIQSVQKAAAKQEERINAVQKQYDQIDAAPADFDGALSGLRRRSSAGDVTNSSLPQPVAPAGKSNRRTGSRGKK